MNNYPVVYAVLKFTYLNTDYNSHHHYYPFYYGVYKCYLLETRVHFDDDGRIYHDHYVDYVEKNYKRVSGCSGIRAEKIFLNLNDAIMYKNIKNEQLDLRNILYEISFDKLKNQILSLKKSEEENLECTSKFEIGYKKRTRINKPEVSNE